MVDNSPVLPVASFCAGVGMLDIGFGCAVPIAEPILYVEREIASARIMESRMQDLSLARAPVWSDLTTFDGRPWSGRVFGFTAGLPCQPYSNAGKRIGNNDDRSHGKDGDGPIPHFLRIVGEVRPAMVFLENVPAWVMGGHFRSVGEELSGLGYTIEEPMFVAAEDVGASHRRERVFILAHAKDSKWWSMADPDGKRLQGERDHNGTTRRQDAAGPTRLRSGELPIYAPGPCDPRWGDIIREAPAIEPAVRGVVAGMATRVDRLRAIGNGVSPLQAAVAAHVLLHRAGLGWLCSFDGGGLT